MRGALLMPLRAVSLRCSSSCLAFRLRSSVASSSLFCGKRSAQPRQKKKDNSYASNDFLYALLVALHLQERLDLAQRQVFPVPQSDQLVKGAQQLVGIAQDLALVEAAAEAAGDLCKQMQGINVLKNVGLEVGDQDHVELVQRLVDEADVVLLNGGVLRAAVGQLRERRQEGLDAGPGHLAKQPREHGFAAPSADGGSEDNLERVKRRTAD